LNNDTTNFVNLSVVSVNNHPQWLNCTSCAGDNSMSDFGLKPDVSLIIVNETTPSAFRRMPANSRTLGSRPGDGPTRLAHEKP